MRRTFCSLLVACCLAMMTPAGAAASPPSTQSADDVASLLHRVDAAYAKLNCAEFDGRIIGHADVAGQQRNDDLTFTSTFRAPNRFRHEAKGDVLIGSTGDTAFVYQPAHNLYTSSDSPKDRAALSDWPGSE